MRLLLCLIFTLYFNTVITEKGPCAFKVNRATCTVMVGTTPVYTTVTANHCHQPVDVTFLVKVQNPEINWRHTFVTTNSAETQEVPGFYEKLLLHVTLSNLDPKQILLRADFHYLDKNSDFFVDTTLHLDQLPDCKQQVSSNTSHIVAGVMMPLLLLVLATGGILLYCKCKKSTLDQMALVDNAAGIPGASPYQEGNPRIEFNRKDDEDKKLVIENCFVTTRSESYA